MKKLVILTIATLGLIAATKKDESKTAAFKGTPDFYMCYGFIEGWKDAHTSFIPDDVPRCMEFYPTLKGDL